MTGTEHSLPSFMRIAEYRPDHGHRAWAARCWGDGQCDGWLSLDHTTERWAQQAARRHLAEDHPDSTSDSKALGPIPVSTERLVDELGPDWQDRPDSTGRTPQVNRGGQPDSGAGGGYCPACGRGDCAPTADQWYAERQRADRAEAALDRVRAAEHRLRDALSLAGYSWTGHLACLWLELWDALEEQPALVSPGRNAGDSPAPH